MAGDLTNGGAMHPGARAALGRVLASQEFSRSERLRRFLTYIVGKALEGHPEEMKEYNIGVAVFDREPSFDPRTDTIVRVEARRLRQQLTAYYGSAGRSDPVVIQVPKGGYAPVFEFRDAGGESTGGSRNRGYLVAAAVSFLCLSAFLLWYTGAYPFVRVPYSWARNGSTLRILDARERLCWEVRLPVEEPAVEGTIRDKAVIADIDGNGSPEVLVNVAPKEIAETGGYLQCFESGGRLRWTHRYGTRKTFGKDNFEPRYVGRFLRVTRAGVLAVAVHHLMYPAVAALLDPKTGAAREEYWHPGAFYECLLRDVDGDGADEAILAAINNPGRGPGHAAVAILKIPFSKAPRRSVQPGHEFPALAGGGELAYVLFPLPDVSRVMGQFPEILRLTVDGSGHILVMTPIPEHGGIIYTLDFNLTVKSHQASDNFYALHERYYRQNLLDHALTSREFEALGKVVSFASAPDGNHPDIARFWRE